MSTVTRAAESSDFLWRCILLYTEAVFPKQASKQRALGGKGRSEYWADAVGLNWADVVRGGKQIRVFLDTPHGTIALGGSGK